MEKEGQTQERKKKKKKGKRKKEEERKTTYLATAKPAAQANGFPPKVLA